MLTVLRVVVDSRVSASRPVVSVSHSQLPSCLKTVTTFGSCPQHSISPARGYMGAKKPVLSVTPQKWRVNRIYHEPGALAALIFQAHAGQVDTDKGLWPSSSLINCGRSLQGINHGLQRPQSPPALRIEDVDETEGAMLHRYAFKAYFNSRTNWALDWQEEMNKQLEHPRQNNTAHVTLGGYQITQHISWW